MSFGGKQSQAGDDLSKFAKTRDRGQAEHTPDQQEALVRPRRTEPQGETANYRTDKQQRRGPGEHAVDAGRGRRQSGWRLPVTNEEAFGVVPPRLVDEPADPNSYLRIQQVNIAGFDLRADGMGPSLFAAFRIYRDQARQLMLQHRDHGRTEPDGAPGMRRCCRVRHATGRRRCAKRIEYAAGHARLTSGDGDRLPSDAAPTHAGLSGEMMPTRNARL